MLKYISITALCFILFFCNTSGKNPIPGAWQIEGYRDLFNGKSVAVVANQTSMVRGMHLIDYLLKAGIDVQLIFAPEHGYRELAADGEIIADGKDIATGLPVRSLYGTSFKPGKEDLENIDIVIFDIQDVGVRFYTYTSTLHYVLEACAENNVSCIVLDRPNPNGYYVDGNIPDPAYRSMVGMHPVPIVHGMTIGEYALMINGEGWLNGRVKCDLKIIKCLDYTHDTFYDLPVRPSPNLPNQTAVYLYPTLCLFEGTNISVGRGTHFPFQVFGSPLLPDRGFSFTPEKMPESVKPPLLGIKCFGTDLRDAMKLNIVPRPEIDLGIIITAYNEYPQKEKFFIPYFDKLAGGPVLREQISHGLSPSEIRKTWKPGLEEFMRLRSKYLLYE